METLKTREINGNKIEFISETVHFLDDDYEGNLTVEDSFNKFSVLINGKIIFTSTSFKEANAEYDNTIEDAYFNF